MNTLTLGFKYEVEKDPKYFISALIIDTENAIRHLDTKIQNTFLYSATKKVKQILTNSHNTLHKIHQHNLNQIKNILQRNNLTIAKADKGKTMVIIDKNTVKQKIDTFIHEKRITRLNSDLTYFYQKETQQATQKCDILVDKRMNKHLINIKPTAVKLIIIIIINIKDCTL